MEVHGGEGVQRFFQYLADRTDLALGMFNSPSSGYVLTPAEMAAIYDAIPRSGRGEGRRAGQHHADAGAARTRPWSRGSGSATRWCTKRGWLQDGIVGPAQLGTAGYLYEAADDKWYTRYWELITDGELVDARALSARRIAQFAERVELGDAVPGPS